MDEESDKVTESESGLALFGVKRRDPQPHPRGVTTSAWREYQNLSDNSADAAELRREGGCPQPPRYVGGGSDQLPEDSRAAEFIPWLSILIPRNAAAEDPSSQNFVFRSVPPPQSHPADSNRLETMLRRGTAAALPQPMESRPISNRDVLRFFSTHLWLHPPHPRGVTTSAWREYQNLSDNSADADELRREGGCPQPPRYVGGGSDQLPEDARAAEFIPWLSILIPRNAAAEDSRPPLTDGISAHFKIAMFCDFSPRTCGYTPIQGLSGGGTVVDSSL